MKIGRVLLAGALVVGAGMGGQAAEAAATNDAFADAVTLTANTVINGDTTGVTRETGEPDTSCAVDPSGKGTLWYRFSVTTSGVAEIAVNSDDFDDFAFGLYRGTSLAGLTPVACADSASGESHAVLSLTAGTYALAVQGSWGSNDGPFTLDYDLSPNDGTRPMNDEQRGAIDLSSASIFVGDTSGSRKNNHDPALSCTPEPTSASVWYRITPTVDGTVFLRGAGLVNDAIAGFASNRNGLAEIGCGSQLELELSAGASYLIEVAGARATDRGPYILHATFVAAPPNDDFANAQPITLPAAVTGNTLAATREPGEPADCNSRQGSVWYSFVSPTNGQASVDARSTDAPPGTVYPLVTGVYRGTTLGGLSPVVCADGSAKEFVVQAGVTYYVDIAEGYFPGPSELDIQFTSAPANDEPSGAIPLATGTFAGSTAGATRSATEPGISCSQYVQATVWYSYSSATAGSFVLDLSGRVDGAALYRVDGQTFAPVVCQPATSGPVTINQALAPGAYAVVVWGPPLTPSTFTGTFAFVP